MGDGDLVVFVLCGGGFCMDSGGFSVGAGVWVLVNYPQKCIEAIQKKKKKFVQHTHLVKESYSSLKREILLVCSPPLSHCYTLEDICIQTKLTYLECFGVWESIGYLPK